MKYSSLKFMPILLTAGWMALSDGLHEVTASDATLLELTGQGTTGPGGYDLAISAQLTTIGATGYGTLAGGASGPVLQVVPPGSDACGCWCINVQRTDTLPSDGDQRINFYIRDTGDGITNFDQISFITSVGIDCSSFSTDGMYFIPLVEGDFKATITDSDGDGVPDYMDQCPDTPAGAVVDKRGCSIDQLVPCAGPATGGTWKNHGKYVTAIVKVAHAFRRAGLISAHERKAIVRAAAKSNCGKK